METKGLAESCSDFIIFFHRFRYKTHQEYAIDARLVFNNCQTFNEDDSAVGRAGHTMREFFEERFQELCSPGNS